MPRAHALLALCALNAMRDQIAPRLEMSEVRTIAADDLWMSPFYGRDCVALHFTSKPDWDGVRVLLPRMETALAPFEPAPHWGKLFTMPTRAVQSRYVKLPRFQDLLRRYDPAGTFRNAFLDAYIFGAPKSGCLRDAFGAPVSFTASGVASSRRRCPNRRDPLPMRGRGSG